MNWPVNATPADVLAKTKNITADNPASDSTPLYSPDGKYIAYRAQQRPGYESDRFRLMLYDRKTGEKANVTEEFDRWIGTFTWSPDSRVVYFSAEDKGRFAYLPVQRPGRRCAASTAAYPCCGVQRRRDSHSGWQISPLYRNGARASQRDLRPIACYPSAA